MLPPLPKLSEYSVSAETGFLPDEEPISHLPDVYYQPWETIIGNLQALILAKRIRQVVDRMPLLSTERLRTEREWRRAYVILGFLTHSYIWGGERPADRLPRVLSVPLIQISTHLELPPIATYAGLCLWNFRAIFPDEPIDLLENLATIHTFTGSLDESWFYLVSVAIEARGAPIIPIMLHAINAARLGDSDMVLSCLEMFTERLDELSELLTRMYENCDPHVFYYRIRPFLAGSKNMADAGLPHGVMLEDETGRVEYKEYSGGSNAQSSLIQAFDILLGIEHRPTGIKKGDKESDKAPGTAPPSRHNFIQDMRSYMPGPHRRFLEHLTTVANIADYVSEHADADPALAHAYDTTLHALRNFRDKHIQIVSRYIIIPAREKHKSTLVTTSRPTVTNPAAPTKAINTIIPSTGKGLAGVNASKKGFRGTGGTALIPFLKQARDETTENAVGDWVKRIASPARRMSEEKKAEEKEKFLCGLAGMWLSGGEMGGLCSF